MKTNAYYRLIGILSVSILAFSSGCQSMSSCCDCHCPSEKSAKTLFSWAVGPDEDKKTDKDKEEPKEKNGDSEKGKNGNGEHKANDKNGNGEEKAKDKNGGENNKTDDEAKEPEKPKPIETDRPDFTEASSTVGRGRIQLESGYTFIRDRANGTSTDTHSLPEVLLRVGMFADWFELRLGQNYAKTRSSSPGFVESLSGAEDLYLGTKLALTEQKKYLPETALILQMTVPTGQRDFTANQVLPGMNYLFGWDVIEDCLSFAGSLQANRAIDDTGHYYTEVAQSLTVGYTLTQKLGAYTEWFAFYPSGSIAPDFGPQHYFDGGFTYKVTDDFQLDIRAGIGLNRHAEDFFVGSGFAVRY